MKAAAGELDPLLWAKKPKSQQALELMATGAKEGDARMAEILAGHVRDGLCTESGNLLVRWDGMRWISLDADHERMRYAS